MTGKNIYSVSQVNNYIKNMFGEDYLLARLYVKGEVSNCKYHTSGHIYFSLKDRDSQINAVMFAGNARGMKFRLQNGQQVIALGSISVYEKGGYYQFYAKEIIQDGAGLLYAEFERLKNELEEMGMFAAEYKKPIPKFVKKVGIVTAPTGAAIQDIRNIASRRNPYVQLILCPAQVQGAGAAETIVEGIERLDAYGVDVIIVGRGGGSIEDLWAFNEEAVARAIFACQTPVISAVGHETDTTIADYVADLRAPTPSAAAELAVFDVREIEMQLEGWRQEYNRRMNDRIRMERMKLENAKVRLQKASPAQKLKDQRMQALDCENRLELLMKQKLERKKNELALLAQRLEGASPLRRLKQGYSYVEAPGGAALTSIEQVKTGDPILVNVVDGVIKAEVKQKEARS